VAKMPAGYARGDRPPQTRGLLTLAVFSAGLFVAVYLVFVQTAWGQRLDDAALAGRGRLPPPVIRGVLDLLATIDLGSLLVALVAIVALGSRRGHVRLAVAAGGVIVGATVSAEWLKRIILTRPALLASPDPFGTGNSLPSGHATVAMSLAMALLFVASPGARRRIALIGGAYAVAIGAAAITAGWHRPSDVVAAYCLVTVWAAVTAAILIARPGGLPGPQRARKSIAADGGDVSARGSVSLAAALAVLFALLVVFGWRDLSTVQFTAAYAAGVSGPALVGIGLVATFRRLLTAGTPL
jgi:membrane-associated phospholipid phosphatase